MFSLQLPWLLIFPRIFAKRTKSYPRNLEYVLTKEVVYKFLKTENASTFRDFIFLLTQSRLHPRLPRLPPSSCKYLCDGFGKTICRAHGRC
jgi:hypothetical protein